MKPTVPAAGSAALPAPDRKGSGPSDCPNCRHPGCTGCAACPLAGARVAVIGGLDRLGNKYCHVVDELGGEGIYHTGKVKGRPARLRNLVGKADLVVFITSINSHNAMSVVKDECRRCRKRLCILRQSGAGSLHELLEGLAA